MPVETPKFELKPARNLNGEDGSVKGIGSIADAKEFSIRGTKSGTVSLFSKPCMPCRPCGCNPCRSTNKV